MNIPEEEEKNMQEFISKEDARKAFIRSSVSAFEGVIYTRILNEIPAADVVEVVRCKDCISYNQPSLGYCEFHKAKFVNPEGYCFWGQRK